MLSKSQESNWEPHASRSVSEQGRWLTRMVRAFLAHHAVPGNARAITVFVSTSPGTGSRCSVVAA